MEKKIKRVQKMQGASKIAVAIMSLCMVVMLACGFWLISGNSFTEKGKGANVKVSAATEYVITLPTDQVGYRAYSYTNGQTTVEAGKDYTFVFGLESNYSKSNYKIYATGESLSEELTVSGSLCTITNVTESLTITVEGVTLNTYNVTLPDASAQSGYTLSFVDDTAKVVDAGSTVAVSFKVTDANTKAKYQLRCNGADVTVGADNVYRTTANGDITFSVVYRAPVCIYYNINGGVGTVSGGTYYAYGETVVLDMNPSISRTGYTFWGWSESSNAETPEYRTATQTSFTIISTEKSQITLYAIWKKAGTVEEPEPSKLATWQIVLICVGIVAFLLIIWVVYAAVRNSHRKKEARARAAQAYINANSDVNSPDEKDKK